MGSQMKITPIVSAMVTIGNETFPTSKIEYIADASNKKRTAVEIATSYRKYTVAGVTIDDVLRLIAGEVRSL